MYFWCFGFRGELGFLNCDDVCMCVVNKQFELLEFVSESVYVDLQYNYNNNNNCLKSNIQCIEIRVQWTMHLGSSHMHV